MKKLVLGLSGGVDSAVAAALLKKDGAEVCGVYLDIGGGDADAAARLAAELGISFETVDISLPLEKLVKRPFTEAYLRGETPNPCVMCNPCVKFPALMAAAERMGADGIATGHYARVSLDERSGRYNLMRSVGDNDQSYMLCGLGQDILCKLELPLGGYEKSQIRAIASELGISVAKKPDSMEICFVPGNDYAAFIEARCGELPTGDFVDEDGNFIAKHRGIHRYTVGQRRGLGVSAGHRVFVSKIDSVTNRITLSGGDGLYAESVSVRDVNWIYAEKPDAELECEVRVRHSRFAAPARVMPDGDSGALVRFVQPVRAPTRGQAAVFYSGELVLGGGTIE